MVAASKSTKKRPAVSQGGPKPKKVHVEKPAKSDKKRSRPVTLPARDVQSATDSEAEDDEEDQVDAMDEAEEMEQDEYPMEVTDAPQNKRTQLAIARALILPLSGPREQRRAAKPHSTLLADAKRVWCLANAKNVSSTDRQKHIHDLMDDIVFKHDASRIVQTVVKHGRQKERDEIAAELKGKYKELAQNKYSKFQGHVLRLLLHREATSLYTNAYERTMLVRDFYGKETALFTVTRGSEEDKERAGRDPERRKRVLSSMKEALTSIFNNSDKGAVTHAVVHRALWEYIVAVNDSPDEADGEKQLREIFEVCQDVLAELVHTKDGSRVVREFLARGSAKDRKQILKVLKPHLVLFTALDVIDDTKLVIKTLVPEMTAPANTLCQTPQGRRALLYLIVPRTRRHFTPAQIASLAETDEVRARTSKKTQEVREAEIRAGASEALGGLLLRETGASLVVTEIMLFAEGDHSPHPIDLPHASRLYKALLQGGHFNRATSKSRRRLAGMPALSRSSLWTLLGRRSLNGDGGKAARKTLKDWFGSAVVKEIENGEAKGKKILLEKIAAYTVNSFLTRSGLAGLSSWIGSSLYLARRRHFGFNERGG
ncbi:armadillo-type protein [Mycena leptocephala]|nr:armadillo-type protein [Mycena leptocephala]